ncbi:MAG: hypothetical protein PHZ23_15095 [Acidiphilium sp.]|nr:hypothetical protein [Acidiphilium sp.]
MAALARPLAAQFGKRLAARYSLQAYTEDLIQNIWIMMTTEIPREFDLDRPLLPFVVSYARNQALTLFSAQVYASGGTSRAGMGPGDPTYIRPSSGSGADGFDDAYGDMIRVEIVDQLDIETSVIADIDRRLAAERLADRFDFSEEEDMANGSGPKPEVGEISDDSTARPAAADGMPYGTDAEAFLPIVPTSMVRKKEEKFKYDPELRAQVARVKEVRDLLQLPARRFAEMIDVSYAMLLAYTKYRVRRIPDKVMQAVEGVATAQRRQFKSQEDWEAYRWLTDAPMVAIVARWAEALDLPLSDVRDSLPVRHQFADALHVPRPSVWRWLTGQKPAIARIMEVDRKAARIKAARLRTETRRRTSMDRSDTSRSPVPQVKKIKVGSPAGFG